MCGIAGLWSNRWTLSEETAELLAHRGPDDCSSFRTETQTGLLELIHRRLAILDPSPAARQPMTSPDGRFTIVYNGEIYNYPELRRTLSGKYDFRSTGDTEVFLNAYREWGNGIFRNLDGMFAAAIWDAREHTLILARDPFGIKPLYIATLLGHGIAFASEFNVLVSQQGVSRTLRSESIAEFLTFLWIPEPATMLQHVTKIPPGSIVSIAEATVRSTSQYVDTKQWFATKRSFSSEEEAADEVTRTFTESIRGQMASDVPVGVFLSGGLDSTAIALEMTRQGGPVTAQTVGFLPHHQRYELAPDDVGYAERVAKDNQMIHLQKTILEASTLDLLPTIVRMLGDPIADPAAISLLRISQAIRPTAKVVLSGMGAEEWWNGYARYRGALLAVNYWGHLPSSLKTSVRWLLRHCPASAPGPLMAPIRQAKKFVRTSGMSLEEAFLSLESYYHPNELNRVLTSACQGADPWERHRHLFADTLDMDPLDRMSFVDTMTFLPSLNLHYSDRASMAASIEIRVPFLATAFCRLAAQMPSTFRSRRGSPKHVLRIAFARLGVPRYVTRRRKAGFGGPLRAWFAEQTHPLIGDLIGTRAIQERGIVRPEYVARLRREALAGVEDHGFRLYALMILEQWFREFIDGTVAQRAAPSHAQY